MFNLRIKCMIEFVKKLHFNIANHDKNHPYRSAFSKLFPQGYHNQDYNFAFEFK